MGSNNYHCEPYDMHIVEVNWISLAAVGYLPVYIKPSS